MGLGADKRISPETALRLAQESAWHPAIGLAAQASVQVQPIRRCAEFYTSQGATTWEAVFAWKPFRGSRASPTLQNVAQSLNRRQSKPDHNEKGFLGATQKAFLQNVHSEEGIFYRAGVVPKIGLLAQNKNTI